MEVPGAVCTVPAGHEPSGTQVVWLEPLVYVPPGQAVQTWLVVAVPGVDTNVPATHVVHAAQVAAFVVALKVALVQAVHA